MSIPSSATTDPTQDTSAVTTDPTDPTTSATTTEPAERSDQEALRTTGAAVTVRVLEREGVEVVFGLPGTTVMDLIDELGFSSRVRYLVTRHEQVAAFMADGYARASGTVGVCLASRGPGAANLAIGVHNAHAESVPLVALVGQVADRYRHRDAFEEVDLTTFFAPITKWGVEVHDAARIPELVQRAVRTALSPRPGAVLVSLPHDVQTSTVSGSAALQAHWRVGPSGPAADDVSAICDLLARAERPVMILGGGAEPHEPAFIELARRYEVPVVTTWLRKSQFPNQDPGFLGCLGYGAVPTTREAVAEADLVLAFGCKMSEFTTERWTLLGEDTKLVHVDVDPDALGRVRVPAVGVLADATLTARAILAQVDSSAAELGPLRGSRRRALRQRYLSEVTPPATPSAAEIGKVSSRAVLDALQSFVDREEAVLVADAPGFGTWIHRYLTFQRPRSFYGASGGSMGWGFPAAMGIQLARPQAQVVTVAGDGSFWMVAQDLETAVREDIPVVVVVTNNFAFGNTRDRQRTSFGGRYHGVFYNNPDFAAFAQLLGAHGERVQTDAELQPALERALASGRPAVVDVLQDRMEGLPEGLVPPGAQTPEGEASR